MIKNKSRTDDYFNLAETLFDLSPPHIRYQGLQLPVGVSVETTNELTRDITELLLKKRFIQKPDARYEIVIRAGSKDVELILRERESKRIICRTEAHKVDGHRKLAKLINDFIAAVFHHHIDKPSNPLSEPPILKGLKQ